MLIDWFTFGAQALNFVILVWLMKRFLYRPIIDAIDAREKRIDAELAAADRKAAEARNDSEEFERKSAAFERERADLLSKATNDARTERQRLLAGARDAADALAVARRESMANDAKNLNQALRQRAQAEVFAVARKTLADLATTSFETSACAVFIERLRALDGSARDDLANALRAAAGTALLRSAFELPMAQRTAVHDAIDEIFALQLELRYETTPDLVAGIELSAHGQKFAWSIDDYLASLERGVDELLKAPAATPVAAPVTVTKESAGKAVMEPGRA